MNISNNDVSTHTLSNRKWYAENKEAILAYKKEKIQCNICNKMVARGAMSKHKNSNYHIGFINKLNELNIIRDNLNNIDDSLFNKLKNLIK
jgi:hypothetical protein